MTLPQNVADAVKSVRRHFNLSMDDATCEAWQTIRAHLMSQEAEIERLNAEWHEMFDRSLLAESHLAAANALLRECHCYFEARGVDSRTIGESLSLNEKIQSHLQGAGDEAAASPEFLCPCGSSLCNGKEDEA